MPRELAVVLAGQQNCGIATSRNQNAFDTVGWSFTPLTDHHSLQTVTLLNTRSASLSKLDFLVLADDHGFLSSIGVLVSSAPALRCLKVQVIDTTPPFASPTSRISQRVLLKGLDWLQHPLLRAEMRLRLEELELTNICVCGSECSPLDEVFDTNVLRSLKLSCMQLPLYKRLQFRSLRELRLGFRGGPGSDPSYCTTEWRRETIRTALLDFSSLKVLEIVNRVDVLTELVLRTLGPRLIILLAVRHIPGAPIVGIFNNGSTAA
jgi:hypothetical protein